MIDVRQISIDICKKYTDCNKCPLYKELALVGYDFRICDLVTTCVEIIDEMKDHEIHRNDKQE